MTFRRRNDAVTWRELELQALADAPICECGEPARELHRVGGCFAPEELQSDDDLHVTVCRDCHDAAGCPSQYGDPLLLRVIEAHE